MLNSNLDCFSLSPIGGRYTPTRDGLSHEKIPLFTTCFMLTNSSQLAQDFWEYIPAMTITDCCYFPLCLLYWCCPMISDDRRKFRSQISDNMDREEKKKEDQSRESQKKEDPGARKKVGKSRNIVFSMIWGSGWSRVGSLKRRCGASWPDERWKIARRCGAKRVPKSKMHETHQVRSTFGSSDIEKSARPCGAKHVSKSKC